jgi:hypothetical protein
MVHIPDSSYVKSGKYESNMDSKVVGSERYKFFSRPTVNNFDSTTSPPEIKQSIKQDEDDQLNINEL